MARQAQGGFAIDLAGRDRDGPGCDEAALVLRAERG